MNNALSAKTELLERLLGVFFVIYAIVSPVSLSATNIAEGLMFIAGFILLYIKGRDRFTIQKEILILFLLLFSWAAISALISDFFDPKEAFSDIWEYTPIILYPLFLRLIVIKKERIIMQLLIISSIVCLLGIVQYFFPSIIYPIPRQPFRDNIFKGFFGMQLHTAGFYSMISLLALALILFWECENKKKFYLWLFFILNIIGTSLTGSRSYLISVSLTLLILFSIKNSRWFIFGGIGFALVAALVLSTPNPVSSRVKTIFDPNFGSNRERIYIWKAAIEMIKDHPIAGIGKGNWGDAAKVYFPKFKGEFQFDDAAYAHAHNVFLTCWAETGIIGLSLFLSFWLTVARTIYKGRAVMEKGGFDYALLAGSLAALGNLFIAGMFENNFGSSIILLLLSLLIGLSLSAAKEYQGEVWPSRGY